MASMRRRRYPRFTVQGVHGRIATAIDVEVMNMSLGGLAIKSPRRLTVGSACTLHIEIEGADLSLTGTVVWSVLSEINSVGEETVPYYSAGLSFADVINDRLQLLLRFIDAHKVTPEHRLTGIRFQIRSARARLDGEEGYRVKLISRSGMLIETERLFDLDQVYPMEIVPPDRDPITFSGRVASRFERRGEGPGRHELGIEFLEMTPDNRARLESFVDELSAGA